MRAAIFRNRDFVVDTVADPKPAAGQVLVKTLCCGICGTDLHTAKYTDQFVERSKKTGGRWTMDPNRDLVFGQDPLLRGGGAWARDR
jgi:threonine dehydrogenase-like Zn-dependent dehydrogenase